MEGKKNKIKICAHRHILKGPWRPNVQQILKNIEDEISAILAISTPESPVCSTVIGFRGEFINIVTPRSAGRIKRIPKICCNYFRM